jgi:hypothetical protein
MIVIQMIDEHQTASRDRGGEETARAACVSLH